MSIHNSLNPGAGANGEIRLLVSDIDGTLIRHDKLLTDRSISAVRRLRAAGVRFTLVSSRPPKGMLELITQLKIEEPIGAFNGALLTKPDGLTVLFSKFLNPEVAKRIIALIMSFGMDVWLYTDKDWFVPDRHGWHVDHETDVVKFEPLATKNFNEHLDRVGKIVSVCSDTDKMSRCEAELRAQFNDQVSATRSQPYYIDITDPAANKGDALLKLAHLLNIRTSHIATIGDAAPDVLMFQQSGMSIAMGNATPEVQGSATCVTTSNEEEGFANAVERFVLGKKAAASAESSG